MDYKKIFKGTEEIFNTLPETYCSQNNGKLFLFVCSSCVNEKRKGIYRIMLKYRDSKKLITQNLQDVSDAGECSLIGLLEAIKLINLPNYEVNIITGIGLGFNGTLNRGKSSHKDLVLTILEECDRKQITIKELVFKGNSKAIKQSIDTVFPFSKTKSNDPKEKTINLENYSQALVEQVKKEVMKDIIINMFNFRFNNETISKICNVSLDYVKEILNSEK